MRNIKKTVILFLISLVLVLGLGFVEGSTTTKQKFLTYYDLGNITVALSDVNASHSANYLGVQYLRNDTYKFNISITNDVTGNITQLNITLPSQITWIIGPAGGANASTGANTTNRSSKTNLGFSLHNLTLKWNVTSGGAAALINRTGKNYSSVKFGFFGRVRSGIRQSVNITIKVTYNGSRKYETYKLVNNLTVDGDRPTSFTAKTRSPGTINLTFPENMNMTICKKQAPNVTLTSRGHDHFYNTSSIGLSTTNVSTNMLWTMLTSQFFYTNETPAVKFNRTDKSGVNKGGANATNICKDLAGNPLKANITATSTDGAIPGASLAGNLTIMSNGTMYSYYNKTLTLVFNETVDRTTLNCDKIYINASHSTTGGKSSRKLRLSDAYCLSNSTDDQTNRGDRLKIVLSNAGRDKISGWRSYIGITLNHSAIKDMSGNNLTQRINSLSQPSFVRISFLANDTTRPNVTSVVYNYNNRTIIITFNESVIANETVLNAKNITLANATIYSVTNLTGKGFLKMSNAIEKMTVNRNGTVINITISRANRDKVENWSKSSLYIAFNESNFRDLAGNKVHGRGNRTGRNLTTYQYDATAPTCQVNVKHGGVLLENAQGTYLNVSWRLNRTGTGHWNISVLFNETMEVLTNASVTIQKLDAAGAATDLQVLTYGTPHKARGNWINKTRLVVTFNLTPSLGDGTGKIWVRARDIRGNLMANTSCRTWLIDTTRPKLLAAYYVDKDDRDFDDYRGDEIVLIFNENVSVRRSDKNTTLNISTTNAHQTLSSINVTNATYGAGPLNRIRNGSMVNISIKNPVKLVIRGVFSPNKNASLNATGIDVGFNQTQIVDAAGNPASRNNSPVDIADTAWSFLRNISTVIATPYCVNTTLMESQLNSTTGSCRYYTNGAWRALTTGAFQPLVAYSCKFTADTKMLLYTRLNQSCNLYSVQQSLAAGWNLVALDTHKNQTAQILFKTLDSGTGDASGASYYYTTANLPYTSANTRVINTGATLETTRVSPYVGYWASLKNPPSGTAWTFTGAGFY